ncbi:AMP-binding protein [Pleomorphomonas oryzae]|uniref:AMP-binding protein n=1 Tax=Pleomorphomonas oryzae TaxID=261934 RepID=UPI0004077D65|nr:class I adenylate-forming enzyme family protein [Pleomorphomonas oryzae]
MILTSEQRTEAYVASGAWNNVTLGDLLHRSAVAAPETVAFEDVGVGAVPGLSARYSFADAEKRINGLAAFFATVGLRPDMVLGIHLPPCADAAIILFAALKAGLVVAPLPIYWTKSEIEAAIEAASIKAMVTGSEIENEPSGELVRDVAADTFAIRFVFAVGDGQPDGLIDLSEVLADLDALGDAPEVTRRGEAADHIALLSMARTPDDELLIVPYSHNQLMAIATGHLIEAGIVAPETVLSTMHPASLASVAGSMATALMSGGRVAFHHGTSLAGLADAVETAGADRVVLPEVMVAPLAASLDRDIAFSAVGAGLGLAPAPAARTVDLVTLGGLCLIPRGRDASGGAVALPIGEARMGGLDAAPVLFEARIKAKAAARNRRAENGELLLGGAAIPDAPWPEPQSGRRSALLGVTSDGFLRTGLAAEEQDGRLVITGTLGETIGIAGITVSPKRLDALFRTYPGVEDAAVFPIEAGPVGHRLGLAVVPKAGERPSLTELLVWLEGEEAGKLDRPAALLSVSEIPRDADGTVRRQALFLQAVA